MKNRKMLTTFIAGVLAGVMLIGGGTAALAAEVGSLRLSNLGLTINHKAVIQPGEGIPSAAGQVLPSSISYTGEDGTETVYMPIETVAQLLNIPVYREKDRVWLGLKPYSTGTAGSVILTDGSGQVLAAIDEEGNDVTATATAPELPAPPWVNMPLHRAGTAVGGLTEVEPCWPALDQIRYYPVLEETITSISSITARYREALPAEGGTCALRVTNHTQVPLALKVSSLSTITEETFSYTLVPAGETVVRTFSAGACTGPLGQPDLSVFLMQIPGSETRVREMSATISMAVCTPETP